MYTTIDTGHQTGQRRFQKPGREAVRSACTRGGPDIWLGTAAAHETAGLARCGRIGADAAVEVIMESVAANPQLFCEAQDADLYRWIDELGCYSPVMHLQQTDGAQSAHRGFKEPFGAGDIVVPEKVLESLAVSYLAPEMPGLPKADAIHLTFELFFPTSAYNHEIVATLKESVDVWRRAVPYDGIRLSEALAMIFH